MTEPGLLDDEVSCETCQKPVKIDRVLTCVCDKYGPVGHEEMGWCSEACMETHHMAPDPDPTREEANA